jgi:hypothetical protein
LQPPTLPAEVPSPLRADPEAASLP